MPVSKEKTYPLHLTIIAKDNFQLSGTLLAVNKQNYFTKTDGHNGNVINKGAAASQFGHLGSNPNLQSCLFGA